MVEEEMKTTRNSEIARREFIKAALATPLVASLPSVVGKSAAQQQPSGTDWPMFQFDTANTGFLPTTSGPKRTVEPRWSFSTEGFIACAPAVVDGYLFIADGNQGRRLYKIDATTGAEIWRASTGGRVWRSSPTVVDDTVYIGTAPVRRGVNGKIHAFAASDGTKQWSFDAGHEIHQSPAVADGKVYFGTFPEPHNEHQIFALDASTGDVLWQIDVQNGSSISSPAVVDGRVYIGAAGQRLVDEGSLYVFDADTGEEIWQFTADDDDILSPTVQDKVVYFGTSTGRLYALDATGGTLLWDVMTAGAIHSSPAVANETVYVTGGNSLHAIDKSDGSERWRFDTERKVNSSPAVVDGVVYFGGRDETVYALDAMDGSKLWHFNVDAPIRGASSPAVVSETLYIGSGAGTVYALEESIIEVSLDIKPGSDPNAINPDSKGLIPVAILQTDEFDPTTEVDRSTLRFGAPDVISSGKGAVPARGGHTEDVDNDGDADLVLHFPAEDTGFDADDVWGKLVGTSNTGTSLVGTDSVKIVRKKGRSSNGGQHTD